jgi:hypothetical protein
LACRSFENLKGRLEHSDFHVINFGGTGGLTLNAGIETLNGANTYTGATTIAGGRLIVTGGSTASTIVNIGSGTRLDFLGVRNDFFPNGTTINMNDSYWNLGASTQHVGALNPPNYADNVHVYDGTLVIGASVYNLVGDISGSIQGSVVSAENTERKRAFSTDSQQIQIEGGGITQLDALAVYPHGGSLMLNTPKCAADFIVSKGLCQ